MAKTTELASLVCTECEANEVLAPIDSTDHKCGWCTDPTYEAIMLERIRRAIFG